MGQADLAFASSFNTDVRLFGNHRLDAAMEVRPPQLAASLILESLSIFLIWPIFKRQFQLVVKTRTVRVERVDECGRPAPVQG
jgi:hypothetical protein